MLRTQASAVVLVLASIAVLFLVTLPALRDAGTIGALVFVGGA